MKSHKGVMNIMGIWQFLKIDAYRESALRLSGSVRKFRFAEDIQTEDDQSICTF